MAITFKEIKAKRAIVRQLKVDLDASRARWGKLNDEAFAEKAKGQQLKTTYDIEIAALKIMGVAFALDEGEEDVTPRLPGIVDAPVSTGDGNIPMHWVVEKKNHYDGCNCGKYSDPLVPCSYHSSRDLFNDQQHHILWNTGENSVDALDEIDLK